MLEVCGATCLLRASIELSLARGALVSLHKASLQRLLLKTDGLQRLGTMESDEAGFGPAGGLSHRCTTSRF